MKRSRYVFSGLVVVALALAVWFPSLLWFAAWLLIVALWGLVLSSMLYKPPEDHLGAINHLDRFHRWVRPDGWAVLIPWVDAVRAEINLQLRQVAVTLSELVTRDQVPVTCEVMVAYRVDPRQADRDLVPQLLGYGKTEWEGLISACLREEAIQAMAGIDLLSLCSVWGLQELKRTLGTRLSERVQSMGVIVVPFSGVMVQGLRPTDAVREVLIQGYAAATLGAATLARVRPILTELEQGDIDNAWNALLLAWGASIVQGASPPSVVVSAAGNGHGPLPDGVSELLGQGPARPGTHPTRDAASGAEQTPTGSRQG